jgi:phosphatidylserine decarboxylase
VSYLEDGQSVTRGQRIGVIKFGSQVDVILPDSPNLEVVARPGDIVRAGVSTIGILRGQNTEEE